MTEAEGSLLSEGTEQGEERKRASRSDRRQTLLNEQPIVLGTTWAQGWCKSMQSDGRLVVGGWPGTLAELALAFKGIWAVSSRDAAWPRSVSKS